jgi:hypothetical protein
LLAGDDEIYVLEVWKAMRSVPVPLVPSIGAINVISRADAANADSAETVLPCFKGSLASNDPYVIRLLKQLIPLAVASEITIVVNDGRPEHCLEHALRIRSYFDILEYYKDEDVDIIELDRDLRWARRIPKGLSFLQLVELTLEGPKNWLS